MNESQIVILDANAANNPLYESWLKSLSHSHTTVSNYDDQWEPPVNCGLLVTAQHYKLPEYGILRRALKQGVPTLIIADGILEYRNTWLHPDIVPGCIFQPVMGHKISCIGRSQARILESWGNLGKCEVVGAPRFDALLDRKPRIRNVNKRFQLLVITARTPGFTADQRALTKRSIQDIKFWLSQHLHWNQTVIEPVWRLTQDLDKEIGVENNATEFSGLELAEILTKVDAVITTPSTSMLEAMLHGLPVALLDYHNCPAYVPAAWTITAPRHIDQVLPELVNPPTARMLYQDTILHDALEYRTPAAPRMVELVEEMLRIAQDCRERNRPIVFPRRILTDRQDGHHLPEDRFGMPALFPDHSVFAQTDQTAIQIELEHSREEVKRLRSIIKADNFVREILKSFPGPRKLLRFWRESHPKV